MKKTLYRLKWILSPYINFRYPVHIDLELSTKCNLNCEFCFRQEIKYKKQDIDEAVLNKVWSEITLWKSPLSVKFNWRGEAVLNPDFYLLAERLKRYGIITELNTSLSQQLTHEQLWCIANYTDRLSISIDSMIAINYEKIRKGADYCLTMTNFDTLYYYRQLTNLPKIIINRRTSKLTEEESDFEFKQDFLIDGKKNLEFNIKPAQSRNNKNIYTKQLKKNKYCGQPSRRMVVGVDGKVFACCHAYKEQPELYLGNVKENSLKELWNSFDKRKKLVQELKNGIMNKACLECPLGGNK
jgi:radical SAM protein with 4Fe4S-binding SPASM domain